MISTGSVSKKNFFFFTECDNIQGIGLEGKVHRKARYEFSSPLSKANYGQPDQLNAQICLETDRTSYRKNKPSSFTSYENQKG